MITDSQTGKSYLLQSRQGKQLLQRYIFLYKNLRNNQWGGTSSEEDDNDNESEEESSENTVSLENNDDSSIEKELSVLEESINNDDVFLCQSNTV